jgi:hypothetical protein
MLLSLEKGIYSLEHFPKPLCPFFPFSETYCRMCCIYVSKSSHQKSWAPGVSRAHGGGQVYQEGCWALGLENILLRMDQVDDAGVRVESGTQ